MRFITLLFLTLASCKEPASRIVKTTPDTGLKEERLGQSGYYIKIPSTMFIEEARGKEGQHGYGLWLIDSINRYTGPHGFIETEHGRPIGGKPDCDITVEKRNSDLLGSTTEWSICRNENSSYFSAIAYHGTLTLSASSSTRPGLDSMISIITTLTSR